jgi:hypothetical protein
MPGSSTTREQKPQNSPSFDEKLLILARCSEQKWLKAKGKQKAERLTLDFVRNNEQKVISLLAWSASKETP